MCEWEGDKLSVWISTQGINAARENFATALELPQANVRVQCQYMGGGFGSKALSVGAEGLICAQLARQVGKPVKLMLDRKEGPDFELLVDPETKLLKQINLVIEPEILAKTAAGGNKLSIEQFGSTRTINAASAAAIAMHAWVRRNVFNQHV